MNALQTSYEAKLAQYNTLIATNDPTKLSQIQSLNAELAALLHSMLEKLNTVKSNAANLTAYHDELINELVGIQNDASILREQRDQYATLHMLQTQDQAAFKSSFFWYAISLGLVAILFFFVLVWKGGYTAPMMPAITSSPNTMADFT